MSSPNLNNSVLLGCTLSYISVFLFGLDGGFISSGYEIICVVSLKHIRLSVLTNGLERNIFRRGHEGDRRKGV